MERLAGRVSSVVVARGSFLFRLSFGDFTDGGVGVVLFDALERDEVDTLLEEEVEFFETALF